MENSGNLTKFRRKKNLTISELAEKVGVSGTCIYRYEEGTRKMSVEMAKRIAEVLKIKWWRLYD